MAQREQKTKTAARSKKAEAVEEDPPKSEHRSAEDLKAEMDDLLDNIDEVLEENAADFVAGYIQKGGQ
jgi:ubiquitin-like protein Pup